MEIKKMVMLEMIAHEKMVIADFDDNYQEKLFWEKVKEETQEKLFDKPFETGEYDEEVDKEIQYYYDLFKELKELETEINCDLDEYTRRF